MNELKFGTRLKQLRMERRIAVKEIAKTIGVPVTTYREWEYGREIRGEPYIKIARALDVSVEYLLTGKDQRSLDDHLYLIERLGRDLEDLKHSILGVGAKERDLDQ